MLNLPSVCAHISFPLILTWREGKELGHWLFKRMFQERYLIRSQPLGQKYKKTKERKRGRDLCEQRYGMFTNTMKLGAVETIRLVMGVLLSNEVMTLYGKQ